PIRKSAELAKTHHVKTSPERQVKARSAHLSFLCLLAGVPGLIGQVIAAEDVDLIFVNGNIYTVNERQAHAEAIAVKKDRIVFVGSNETVKKFGGVQYA